MKIAIDLLWVRVNKVGGTEHFVRNLLEGISLDSREISFVLLVASDNADSFKKYLKDKRFSMLVAPVDSENLMMRLIWQNTLEYSWLKKYGINHCYQPTLFRPLLGGGVDTISTVHDIQPYHYPQYHPKYEVIYSKWCWIATKFFSKKTVAISQFVKDELTGIYHFDKKKVEVIPNPILVERPEKGTFELLSGKYGIEKKEYYYTISQLLPHKNLKVLIDVFEQICDNDILLPRKLVISGGHGNKKDELLTLIKEKHLSDCVILTDYLTVEEKFSMIDNCKDFLFPSIYEGFGMPPVEAMMLSADVITTKCASIPEVTQNLATYVENPYDVNEWIEKMLESDAVTEESKTNDSIKIEGERFDGSIYDKKTIATRYLDLFESTWQK